MKRPAVYIMASKRNGTLYTGVTSDLVQRVWQHRESMIPGFASRYGCRMLVWYELHDEMTAAIAREKQIKAGSRNKKLALIEAMDPGWRELCDDLLSADIPAIVIASQRQSNPGPVLPGSLALSWIAAALRASQ